MDSTFLKIPGDGDLESIDIARPRPDEEPVLLGAKGDYMCRWDLDDGALLWRIDLDHGDDEDYCWLLPQTGDGQLFYRVTETGLVMYDSATGDITMDARRPGAPTGNLWAAAFGCLPNGRPIVAAGGDGFIVYRWDAETGERLAPDATGHKHTILGITFVELPALTMMVTASEDGTVRRWDAATAQPIGEPIASVDPEVIPRGIDSLVTAEGRALLAINALDAISRRVRIHDALTGERIGPLIPVGSHYDYAFSAYLVPDPHTPLLIAMSPDEPLHLWHATTSEYLGRGRQAKDAAVATPPTGTPLVATTHDNPTGVFITKIKPVIGPTKPKHTRIVEAPAISYVKS
jgi:WD40 repeat protein